MLSYVPSGRPWPANHIACMTYWKWWVSPACQTAKARAKYLYCDMIKLRTQRKSAFIHTIHYRQLTVRCSVGVETGYLPARLIQQSVIQKCLWSHVDIYVHNGLTIAAESSVSWSCRPWITYAPPRPVAHRRKRIVFLRCPLYGGATVRFVRLLFPFSFLSVILGVNVSAVWLPSSCSVYHSYYFRLYTIQPPV